MAKKLLVDLGLTYEEAAHGVQSVKAFEEANDFSGGMTPKHLRTGLDLRAADMMGLACLLIDKGIITEEEYMEYMRLGANTELAREQDKYGMTFR